MTCHEVRTSNRLTIRVVARGLRSTNRRTKMNKKLLATTASLAMLSAVSSAQAESLTLCWAAWDPANALIELSKDYEAQSGNAMSFEFVPWTNFTDRMLNELNSGGKLCDLMIGDSQWIGGAAENAQYVKLNDFFDTNGISMDAFIPATVTGYSEWPKTRQTIGHCLPLAMLSVGLTAKIGSRVLIFKPPSRKNLAAI